VSTRRASDDGAAADSSRVTTTADEQSSSAGPDDEGATGESTTATSATSRVPRRRLSLLGEIPVLLAIAVVLALVVKAFVIQAYFIPSGSMERTLLIGDRVFVNKTVYRTRSVHRGEIVVFNGEETGFQQAESVVPPPTNAVGRLVRGLHGLVGLGAPGEKDFITVVCCDSSGRTTVNGTALNEPYIYEPAPLTPGPAGRIFGPVTVPKGYLWVMGDHRSASSDSRANGVIPERVVIGRAFVRVWPLSRFGTLPVPRTFAPVHAPAHAAGPLVPDLGQSHHQRIPVPGADLLLTLPVVLAGGRRLS